MRLTGSVPRSAKSIVGAIGRALPYCAVFAVLGWPWLVRARYLVPADISTPDAWLIVWVVDWVRYALARMPSMLFDPPINYPAPAQLTGSEQILLRPRAEWPSEGTYQASVETITRGERVVGNKTIGPFVLVQLDPTSRHPDWYRSLARGPRPGQTTLETPVPPLSADPRQAALPLPPFLAGADARPGI